MGQQATGGIRRNAYGSGRLLATLPASRHGPACACHAAARPERREASFLIGGDESPRQVLRTDGRNTTSVDVLIEQAYRQIYVHAFSIDRDPVLESQLRDGRISLREFILSLLLTRRFRNDFYRSNSNHRMVDQRVGRVRGRPLHGDAERIALSILIAQQGLPTLVEHLLDSQEYLQNFGLDTVPFQRSRVLPGRPLGELPFNQQAPRYERNWRETMARRAPAGNGSGWQPSGSGVAPRPAWLADAPSPLARRIWQGTVTVGGFLLTGFVLYVAAVMLSTAGS